MFLDDMKLILVFCLGFFIVPGHAASKDDQDCGFRLSDAEIITIAQNELKRLGAIGYKKSRITVFKYQCQHIYAEDYLPETPDRSFMMVISPSGEVKALLPGR